MAGRVVCQNCGGRIDLPDGFAKAKVRCHHCGYYAEVPPEARSAAPASPPAPTPAAAPPTPARKAPRARRSIDPRDHRPKFDAEEPSGPPLLEGTHEDDDRPYPVPGTGTKPCPHCRGDLPLDATLCVHCGADLASGRKAGREFQPIHRTWDEYYPRPFRAKLFAGAVGLDVLAVGLALCGGAGLGVAAFTLAVQVGLQAFLLGTFDALTVRRTAKGQATLTRNRRVGFVPLPPEKLRWKESHAVGIVGSHDPGVFAWMVCAYLFTLLVVPGVVFYWFVLRPERFEVIGCDVHGGTDEVLFRCTDRRVAVEVCEVIADATGLQFRKAV